MNEEAKPKLGWGGPRPGSGRKRGSVDRRPREIRECMLMGAAQSKYGIDDAHPEGDLVVFFKSLANERIELFVSLLTRLVPKQINQQVESTIGLNVVFETVDQVVAELERCGMSHQQIKHIQAMLPVPINEPLDAEMHDEDRLFDDRNRDQ